MRLFNEVVNVAYKELDSISTTKLVVILDERIIEGRGLGSNSERIYEVF